MKIKIIVLGIVIAILLPNIVFAVNFTDVEIPKVGAIKGVKPYKIQSNLSNISNIKLFKLGSKPKGLLAKNAFSINDIYSSAEFFPIYEENRYSKIPNFITTDSILHNYHLLFNYLLKTTETNYLSKQLLDLGKLMLSA